MVADEYDLRLFKEMADSHLNAVTCFSNVVNECTGELKVLNVRMEDTVTTLQSVEQKLSNGLKADIIEAVDHSVNRNLKTLYYKIAATFAASCAIFGFIVYILKG